MTDYSLVVGRENNRRAWCQQKAIFRLYSLGTRRPFSDILEALVRRWPVSVGSDEHFIARLQDIYRREQAARLRPTPGEEKLEREALSYHAAGSPWSAFWYRHGRHARIAACGDPQRLQLLVARLRTIVAGGGTTENQGAGPGDPAAPAVLSSLPPLPPLASRPLEAIRRMAGAPLDPDEAIEAARPDVSERLDQSPEARGRRLAGRPLPSNNPGSPPAANGRQDAE